MNTAADTWSIRAEGIPCIGSLLADDAPPAASTRQVQRALSATGERRMRVGNAVIAVLTLHGVALQRASALGEAFGLVSVERFAQAFRAALANETVSGIVLDIDSPGGSLRGVGELADEIYRARARKSVAAVANSVAAGAAYWLACAAGECYVTSSGEVGAIGVLALHEDWSKALGKQGIATTLVAAGRYKTEQSPYAPLSAAAREHMQSRVNADYDRFARAVARHRGVEMASVRNRMGQGRMLGAEAAKAARMVDGVATLDEVVKKLSRRLIHA